MTSKLQEGFKEILLDAFYKAGVRCSSGSDLEAMSFLDFINNHDVMNIDVGQIVSDNREENALRSGI